MYDYNLAWVGHAGTEKCQHCIKYRQRVRNLGAHCMAFAYA
jgi:hypothetical protein